MSSADSHRVGVLGASGFAGAELMRLCAGHPSFEIVFASAESQAGVQVGSLYPSLAADYPDMEFRKWEEVPEGLDVVFVALSHGVSQEVIPHLVAKHIIDLGADFRLDDPDLYPRWYGWEHATPELLDDFVAGVPELFRDEIRGAPAVAVPGCYVTTATLALAPLLAAGLIEATGIVVNGVSGVSGAGRGATAGTSFSAANENFAPYGLLDHRHTPEMEMILTRIAGEQTELLFTPHLAPMTRGILATCYARPSGDHHTEDLLEAMALQYAGEPFVSVLTGIPSTKATLGSNAVHMTARRDQRTGWVVAIAALDNLVKGASGQAMQCANLAIGIDEASGLVSAGLYP
ncbi:MAG: N-acetyl-gamma-glutamyl-phosphate reductase [Acidimicrobiia bacterium]|nr:MAG: N-acetyl-gamma-glutamyl-phosphate reductase [Acidimicrobiia bacterium]